MITLQRAATTWKRWTPAVYFWLPVCFALFTIAPATHDFGSYQVRVALRCSVPETPIFRVLRWGRVLVYHEGVVQIPYRRMTDASSVAGSCVCG